MVPGTIQRPRPALRLTQKSNGQDLSRIGVSNDAAALSRWFPNRGSLSVIAEANTAAIMNSCFLRCFGAGVPSYLAGRSSLGAFPWFAPLTFWWVHCNTHSFLLSIGGWISDTTAAPVGPQTLRNNCCTVMKMLALDSISNMFREFVLVRQQACTVRHGSMSVHYCHDYKIVHRANITAAARS